MGGLSVEKRYRRSDIQANRHRLYVFGDNLTGLGRGGQAKECRGEPNAVGIVTKWHPTTDAGAYFYDHDLERVKPFIQASFRRLDEHLARGGEVVWPADGVGTGLARLNETAPSIAAFIEQCRQHLARRAEERSSSPSYEEGE